MGAHDPIKHPDNIIILFDGVCNLCNGAVQFIIKRDRAKKFKFASLQSPSGQAILIQAGITSPALQSILVSEHNTILMRSDAALKIAQHLDGNWKYLGVLKYIPRVIRDAVYNFIARYRYSWFGKTDRCMIPTPALTDRFIDS